MSFFEDKIYTDLDWLNRAIEPYEWAELNKFHSIPERIPVPEHEIISFVKTMFSVPYPRINRDANFYGRVINNATLESSQILDHLMNEILSKYVDVESLRTINGLRNTFFIEKFKLEFNELIIDWETGKVQGEMFIVRENIPEPKIPEAIRAILNAYVYHIDCYDNERVKRLKEILDIIGVAPESAKAVRSKTGALQYLYAKLFDIIEKNEWNIKQVALIFKMVKWVESYISHGNLAALTNFTKLKCMTHKGAPIYSMEEIQ